VSTPSIDGFVVEPAARHGASASVHRARSIDDGREVIIKVAHDSSAEAGARFEHEATVLRHLARLATHGVPRVVDAASGDDGAGPDVDLLPALVLEPAARMTLGEHLAGGDSFDACSSPTGEPRSVFVELAGMLAAVHQAGVVHGDLSPANVVLLDDGTPMIIDFASAVVHGAPPSDRATGTPPFVAPEVLAGQVPSPRSDLYSLAMIMVRALLPEGAAEHADVESTLRSLGCPPALSALLARTISPSPDQRPASAAALRDALVEAGPVLRSRPSSDQHDATDDAITLEFGPRPPRRPPPPLPRRHPNDRRLLAGVAAAMFGVVLIAIGASQLHTHSSVPVDTAVPSFAAGTGAPAHGRAPSTRPCPTSAAALPAATATTEITADIDGSGCPVSIVWDADRAEAIVHAVRGPQHFRLGLPGDVLLIGDWDGDHRASPALYRPSTGAVFEFDAWAARDGPAPSAHGLATGVPGGRALVRRIDGRDTVVVEPSATTPARAAVAPTTPPPPTPG
jgi:serine/threonine protein kinase